MNSCFWQNKVSTENGFFVCKRNPENYGYKNSRTGYYSITLKLLDKGFETLLIHRAIWMAANRQRIPKNMQICHRNHDKSDNRISNLFCDTAKNNVLASVKNRQKTRKRDGYKTKVKAIFENGDSKEFNSLTSTRS